MRVQTMPSFHSHGDDGLSRQGSVYGLTLAEVETQLGEPLRTMNLDDFLRTVLPTASPPPAAKRTVDEVWRDIQSAGGGAHQPSMGEMTLEDFLSRAGVAVAVDAAPHWMHQYPPQYAVPLPDPAADVPGDGVVERTVVERRQKRMIKNRESAARSRARKQAYTNELENKIALLEEEIERLRKLKMLKPLELPPEQLERRPLPQPERRKPPPTEHHHLRRTNSASF